MQLTDKERTKLQQEALTDFVQSKSDLLTEALTTKVHSQLMMINRLDQEINSLIGDLKYSREANDEHYMTIAQLRAEIRELRQPRPETGQAWDSKVSFIRLLLRRFDLSLSEATELVELPREEFWHKVEGDLLKKRP